jgi:aryl-alcohol dehydrogenase-like predicted oxidoreductase
MVCATSTATEGYTGRFSHFKSNGFYRPFLGVQISSLGLGTYLGDSSDSADALYVEAIQTALSSGINLLDSAVNYRCMRSERNIGQALGALIQEKKISREEVVLCTKGGFIPYEGQPPAHPEKYFQEAYFKPGICQPNEMVAGCHCMTPAYLRNQVERSLQNMKIETIDLYYVHNPEMQLEEVPREEFLHRLEKAFQALEQLVKEGKIRAYGTATWNGYRVKPDSQEYLSLHDILRTAERAAGHSRHHFQAIQLPYNLGMPEAFFLNNQTAGAQTLPVLSTAQANGIAVFTSASILQARLSRDLPPSVAGAFPGLPTDASRAIQFARSTPGVTAALVGMKRKEHVRENLKVAEIHPSPAEALHKLFK